LFSVPLVAAAIAVEFDETAALENAARMGRMAGLVFRGGEA
jgi:hypothetical protein